MMSNALSPTDKKTASLAAKLNALLVKSGVQLGQTVSGTFTTGCRWCPHSKAFRVWLPCIIGGQAAIPLIHKVEETFRRAGLTVERYDCAAIGADGYIQIDGNMS